MVTEATWVEKAKATYELTKDKAVKIGGAVLVGAGVFASAACGSSEASPAVGNVVAAAENVNVGGSTDEDFTHGECSGREDVYARGTLSVKEESTGKISDQYMAELEDNVFFGDGKVDSDSSVEIKPSAYTEDMLNQIREGVYEVYEQVGLVPGVVYMLGEDDRTQDDFDGEVNGNVRGFCVDNN